VEAFIFCECLHGFVEIDSYNRSIELGFIIEVLLFYYPSQRTRLCFIHLKRGIRQGRIGLPLKNNIKGRLLRLLRPKYQSFKYGLINSRKKKRLDVIAKIFRKR
jgi:hypothetical protein